MEVKTFLWARLSARQLVGRSFYSFKGETLHFPCSFRSICYLIIAWWKKPISKSFPSPIILFVKLNTLQRLLQFFWHNFSWFWDVKFSFLTKKSYSKYNSKYSRKVYFQALFNYRTISSKPKNWLTRIESRKSLIMHHFNGSDWWKIKF